MTCMGQQVFPNEILAQIALHVVETSSVRRGFALRVVNKFFAEEVTRIVFEHGIKLNAFFHQPFLKRGFPHNCWCFANKRAHYCLLHHNVLSPNSWAITEPWIARYWYSMSMKSQTACPPHAADLRAGLVNAVKMYVAIANDKPEDALERLVIDHPRKFTTTGPTLTATESEYIQPLCRAAVFLIGAPVAWSVSNLLKHGIKFCEPRVVRYNLPANCATIWACALATYERKYHVVRALLDSVRYIPKTEVMEDLLRIEKVIASSSFGYFDDELSRGPILRWMDCLAACLSVAVRNDDQETFDFLLGYDKDTRVIGSPLFRCCRFFGNRNVQELTISCGQVTMFTQLMDRGWKGFQGETPRRTIERIFEDKSTESSKSVED